MVVKQTQEGNYSAERYAGPVRVGQVWADCWDLKDEWGEERKGRVFQSEGLGPGGGRDLDLFQEL